MGKQNNILFYDAVDIFFKLFFTEVQFQKQKSVKIYNNAYF